MHMGSVFPFRSSVKRRANKTDEDWPVDGRTPEGTLARIALERRDDASPDDEAPSDWKAVQSVLSNAPPMNDDDPPLVRHVATPRRAINFVFARRRQTKSCH
jgi:hypothetical protein